MNTRHNQSLGLYYFAFNSNYTSFYTLNFTLTMVILLYMAESLIFYNNFK